MWICKYPHKTNDSYTGCSPKFGLSTFHMEKSLQQKSGQFSANFLVARTHFSSQSHRLLKKHIEHQGKKHNTCKNNKGFMYRIATNMNLGIVWISTDDDKQVRQVPLLRKFSRWAVSSLLVALAFGSSSQRTSHDHPPLPAGTNMY